MAGKAERLPIRIADDEKKREQGLMNRKKLKDTEGMIFVFPDSRVLDFWMKNTLIPLSIGYFDETPRENFFKSPRWCRLSPKDQNPKTYLSAEHTPC